jgi:hypothetical protein
MRLLLTSFTTSEEHDAVLAGLIGKAPSETRVAYIENAHDVYDDEESLDHGRQDLKSKGYDVELVDLRQWRADRAGLREKLAGKDLFALAGANPFYLRWLMKVTGADEPAPWPRDEPLFRPSSGQAGRSGKATTSPQKPRRVALCVRSGGGGFATCRAWDPDGSSRSAAATGRWRFAG